MGKELVMIDPELDRMYKEHALAVASICSNEISRKAFEITKNVKTSIEKILKEVWEEG